MRIIQKSTVLGGVAAGLTFLASALTAKATPFASCITNDGAGNMTFYLNESNAVVTVTYEDGTTNASYNPLYLNTGTNLDAGPHTFALGSHTTYSISVYKLGSGKPSIISTIGRGTARGIAANTHGPSKYFGYVYSVIGGAGVVMQYPTGDGVVINTGRLKPPITGGTAWGTGTSAEYFISVAPDDSVLVSDFQAAGGTWPYSSGVEGGVIQVDPTFTTANLLLNGLTGLNSPAGAGENHGVAESRAILTDVFGNNPNLYMIDGSAWSPYNQIVAYSNVTSAGWANLPDYISPSTGPVGAQGSGGASVLRAGLALGTNGYLYVSQDRANLSNPNLQVWNTKSFNPANTNDLYAAYNTTTTFNGNTFPANANLWPTMPVVATNMLWCSYYFTPTAVNANSKAFTNGLYISDYTVVGTPQLPQPGISPSELALSPDNRYIALVHDDNHVTLFTLTNGIPDLSTEYLIQGLLGTASFGRGICWDAAGNLWLASSGLGAVYQISLGRTATAITTGNASGPTGFILNSPTEVDVIYANSSILYASQANPYGNPTAITNIITRSGNVSSPLVVSFTLGGTAPTGTYTITPNTGSIRFAPGQTSTNIVVTAVSDGIPRPTTTVTLTLTGGSSQYNVGNNNAVTDFILNTATPQLVLSGAASTMYNAYSNDFASVTITRWGDTNTAFTTSGFSYGGSAVNGNDYATLSTTVNFAKGDLTKTVNIAKPLINGQPPVHSTSLTYTGNKTIIVAPTAGTGYVSYSSNNTATVTILDSAYPPATVLWSDPLTAPLGGANGNDDGSGQWNTIAFDSDGVTAPDYNADFGLDLTTGGFWGAYGMVPLPPSGATTALRVTCNKIHGGADTVAVNLYPTNVVFSGDYALRFNMFVNQGSGFSTAEGPFFGINHGGTLTNWWYGTGTLGPGSWSSDGVFYWVNDWAAGINSPFDYQEFTGLGGTNANTGWTRLATDSYASYLNEFKTALFTSCNNSSNLVGGLPANNAFAIPTPIGQWADVEIKQVQNVVTMSINKTPIFTYANTNSAFTTLSTAGCLMLGYETPGSSGANSTEAAAYFSNLQVVRLATIAPPTITGINVAGGNVSISFTSPNSSDTTASFVVQSSAVANTGYVNVIPAATITQNPTTKVFTAVTAQNGTARFFRIKHL
jgi:hypothetical protein